MQLQFLIAIRGLHSGERGPRVGVQGESVRSVAGEENLARRAPEEAQGAVHADVPVGRVEREESRSSGGAHYQALRLAVWDHECVPAGGCVRTIRRGTLKK